MSVVLNTEEFIPTQREDIRKEVDQILDDFMEPLVHATIITEIKNIAMAANIPQGFIDGVKFRKTGPNKGQVINTWGTTKTPLAIFFNYGTVQHWIQPVTAKALAFPGGEGKHATAIYFQGESKATDTLFSMGHYVSGVPKTEAMEIGFNLGKSQMAAQAAKIIERELRYE